jgi:hypothetical protein
MIVPSLDLTTSGLLENLIKTFIPFQMKQKEGLLNTSPVKSNSIEKD